MKFTQKLTRIVAVITLAIIAIALVEVVGNITAHFSADREHAQVLRTSARWMRNLRLIQQ